MKKFEFLFLVIFLLSFSFSVKAQPVKLVLPSGHLQKILDVAFSEDEQMMASASVDNSVKIWSNRNGKLLQEIKGHCDEDFKVFLLTDAKRV